MSRYQLTSTNMSEATRLVVTVAAMTMRRQKERRRTHSWTMLLRLRLWTVRRTGLLLVARSLGLRKAARAWNQRQLVVKGKEEEEERMLAREELRRLPLSA